MPGTGPIAVCYVNGDAAWAACLMTDLASHGLEVRDATGPDRAAVLASSGGVLVVHSWFAGFGRPTPAEPARVGARGCRIVVARRNAAKLSRDDYPGRTATFALWPDYYQPDAAPARRMSGNGWTLALRGFGVEPAAVPKGFLFLSYRHDPDGPFVQERLRGALALDGYATWSYRASQHIEDLDGAVLRRLVALVEAAAALVVVATSHWWSSWTECELATARKQGKPIVLVRPAGARTSRRNDLAGYPLEVLHTTDRKLPGTVAALRAAGVPPVLPPLHSLR